MQDIEYLRKFLERVLGYGISNLTDSQKRRFAEQLAWFLNIPLFLDVVCQFITPLGAKTPDTNTLALD